MLIVKPGALFLLAPLMLAAGCTVVPPPVAPAPASQASLRVYVEPDAFAHRVLAERGRDVFPLFREELNRAFAAAGYQVQPTADTRHDITVRIKADRVGFAYRPWADGVVVEVSGGGRVLASASRMTLNWMSTEGGDTKTRLAYAADALVNALEKDPALSSFSPPAPSASSSPAPVTPPGAPTSPG